MIADLIVDYPAGPAAARVWRDQPMVPGARIRNRGGRQRGVALIEAMVAVLILALGLLGLAGTQTTAVVLSHSAHYRSVAADLAADLADRVRANRSPFLASNNADVQPGRPPNFARCVQNGDNMSCAPQDADRQSYRVVADMQDWYARLRNLLPQATYTLASAPAAVAGALSYTLVIGWNDNRGASGSEAAASYTVVIE